MGNKLKKVPRPQKINFPEVQSPINYKFELCGKEDEPIGEKGEYTVCFYICALKSGNILITYMMGDIDETKTRSGLLIFNVPDFKLIEKYEFENEIKGITYIAETAIQLKNGNIFSICDKLYIFDGESISNGPKTTSEEVNKISCKTTKHKFPNPFDENNPIFKKIRIFPFEFMFEPKDGTLLYTTEGNYILYTLDIGNLETKGKEFYKYIKPGLKEYSLDIITQSEYYPENLYIIANFNMNQSKYESIVLVFNLNDFCDENNKDKKPLYSIEVSKSNNVFAICEYDKKYLLCDTINNGIYIIDIEAKLKVAVSELKFHLEGQNLLMNYMINKKDNKFYIDQASRYKLLYKKMIKLKDGKVLIQNDSRFCIADIKAQNLKECGTVGE